MGRYYVPDDNNEHQPVTWLNGHAIYAAHFVVVVYVASMLVSTLLLALNFGSVFDWLVFDTPRVFHGQVWRVLTYGLVNPPSFWFVVDMFMLVWFGRELEKFFGRSTFFKFYACLYLLSPAFFCVIGIWYPMSLSGEVGSLGVFIAFATLYPNAEMMFGILAKWWAILLVGIYTLMGIAYHTWMSLLALWVTVGFGHLFIRHEQGVLSLPKFRLPSRKPNLRVLPDIEDEKPAKSAKDASMAEVDALLDKIARSGIDSLTARERAKLDEARARLKKRSEG